MPKTPKKLRKPTPKLGHYYEITYDDHFLATRAPLNHPSTLEPVVLQARGRVVAITPTHINLESCVHGDDQHDIYGIMTSCITNIRELT